MEPRLRTVNKAIPPYHLNDFPKSFIERFAAEIVYKLATKNPMSLEGEEWEQVFASCIDAQWKPSNVGLDDVVLDNCCWSAKTVKSGASIARQKLVRLISGRNSPSYSFGIDNVKTEEPNNVGKMILDVWNERVSGIRQYFKFARTVVLVKDPSYLQYLIFETETVRYDPEMFAFRWNSKGNLEGFSKSENIHRFTWQPHGSQFTIIEEIPEKRLHIRVKQPEKLDKREVLERVKFDKTWYEVVKS